VVEATDAARRAVESMPDANDARRLLARCLRERGDVPQGCEVLIEALEHTPEDKVSRLQLVELLEVMGARDEALAVMAQALDYDGQDAGLYVRLGEMCAERGRAEDAFNAFEIALTLAPAAEVVRHARAALQKLVSAPVAATTATPQPGAGLGLRFGRAAIKSA
jgi:tetratricopeptide (TPR) repeat protein